MNQAIVVFDWNRPRYLRVFLDSLARCTRHEEWPVVLSLDGLKHVREFDGVRGRCAHVIEWPNHVGNLWHVVRSIKQAAEVGYDRILFIDGDMIFRRDTFEHIPDRQPGVAMYCLGYWGEPRKQEWLTPCGNVIYREDIHDLIAYVESRQWVGHHRPGCAEIMQANYPGFDAVFADYLITTHRLSMAMEIPYTAHIGVCGVDHRDAALDSQIFAGPPEQWLDNAIRLFMSHCSPAFVPPEFVYE